MDLKALEVKKDRRGSLVEAFKMPNDGQVFYVIIKPGETRGNHYHTRKTEHFLVIYGSAELQVKDRDTNNVMKVETTGSRPMMITVTPNNTHSITATDEGCVCLIWCDEIFNEADSDTFPEEI